MNGNRLEAWRCANCKRFEVQASKPYTHPGPANRLSYCYDTGHDWQPIWLEVAGSRDHEPDDGELARDHYESLGL